MGLRDRPRAEDATVWRLLALCARLDLPAQSIDELRASAASITDWDKALTIAEYHGLGPLLYRHLKDHSDVVSRYVSRQLQAMYLRHRRSNEVRLDVLAQMLEAFRRIDIEPTVLKGAALITLVYRDPGLRPLLDLDLLVPERDVIRAQRKLGDMGFSAPLPRSRYELTRHHHLQPASLAVGGTLVQVELHHELFQRGIDASFQVTGRAPGALTFSVGSQVGHSLGPDEMLWHLCRHIHQLRLIWVADILGFTERYVDQIDWARVGARYPFVMNALGLIHCFAPLPDIVLERSRVTSAPAPRDIGKEYQGWPQTKAFVWDGVSGRLQFLKRSLAPPEWWLRFYYEAGTGRLPLLKARFRHWGVLVRMAIRSIRDRVNGIR